MSNEYEIIKKLETLTNSLKLAVAKDKDQAEEKFINALRRNNIIQSADGLLGPIDSALKDFERDVSLNFEEYQTNKKAESRRLWTLFSILTISTLALLGVVIIFLYIHIDIESALNANQLYLSLKEGKIQRLPIDWFPFFKNSAILVFVIGFWLLIENHARKFLNIKTPSLFNNWIYLALAAEFIILYFLKVSLSYEFDSFLIQNENFLKLFLVFQLVFGDLIIYLIVLISFLFFKFYKESKRIEL